MRGRAIPQTAFQLLLISIVRQILSSVVAYPVILHVEEDSGTRCFRFNIPEDDEGHVVAVMIPSEEDAHKEMESWYVDQVLALTKKKDDGHLPRSFLEEVPDNIMQEQSKFLQSVTASVGSVHDFKLQITGTPTTDPTNYQFTMNGKFFELIVINNVAHTTMARLKRDKNDETNLEGYGICLTNNNEEMPVQIIFDLVLVSDDIFGNDDEISSQKRFDKDKHLTPLEVSLDQSIQAANSVLREMAYMEKREHRMRQTAESINSRVHWFSYLSVSVLLAVTYIQVTYLKQYFRKKKLM